MTQIFLRSALRPAVIRLPTTASLKAGILELNPPITTAALFVEIALMYVIPTRRKVADLVSRCIVVNAPPLQPHRAPAVPMYSATDGEFGYPPRRPADGKDSMRLEETRLKRYHARSSLDVVHCGGLVSMRSHTD